MSSLHWTDILFYVPMGLMSLAGIALVIWRILLNINGNTNMNEFLPAFQQLEKEGVDGALRYCRSRTDIIPRRLFVAGLENHKQGLAAVRRAMANAIELEILPDLNFLLPPILAIAKVATMVGLLGTVISMIRTFNAIQNASKGDAASQSSAIGLALIATALGLVTAIPLSFAHVLFKAWVAKFETRLKSAAQKLTLLLQNVKPSQGKSGGGGSGAQGRGVRAGVDRRARAWPRNADSWTSGSSRATPSTRKSPSLSSPTGCSRAGSWKTTCGSRRAPRTGRSWAGRASCSRTFPGPSPIVPRTRPRPSNRSTWTSRTSGHMKTKTKKST